MKKVAIGLAFASIWALAFAGVGGATHSVGPGPKRDVVAGTGTLVVPQPFLQAPQVHVNANQNPDTGETRGHFYIRYASPDIDLRGDAVCVDAALTSGTVIGRVERATGAAPPTFPTKGDFVRIRITDNGEPGALDLANWDLLPGVSSPPTTCPAQPGDLRISQGNYVVHDGTVPLSLLSALDLFLADIEAAAGDN
jgi:hypothetical protein